MAKVELGEITLPYEFEDRGNLFITEVMEIEKDFPDLKVDIENKTLYDLENNSWACKKSLEKKKGVLYEKAFERGRKIEILSATESTILVSIYGATRKKIQTFRKRVDLTAKQFQGKIIDEESNRQRDNEAEYGFFAYIVYCFRG